MIEGLVIDSFAGGGGASTGIEQAFEKAFEQGLLHERRFVNYAINHDAEAIAMHTANHPATTHLPCSVWAVNFEQLVNKRAVALMWFSPDCKHFSKAKGGKPVKKNIRDLAWVVVKAARQVRPAVIMLENVEEFQDWGPLIFKRTGDGGTVADTNLFQAGEGGDIPSDVVCDDMGNPVLVPDPKRKGQTFKQWTAALRRLGYVMEWRELRACDYGAPTIRKRFFMIARRDGKRIVWPERTHGDPKSPEVQAGELKPWRTAAEIIDWAIPCPSIFLSKEEGRAMGIKRPLAPATMDRIGKGIKRYVLDAEEPFIVNLTHQGGDRNEPVSEPLKTVTGAHRGEKALVSPVYVGCGGRAAQSPPRPGNAPLGTLTAKADGALITPVMVRTAHGERDKKGKKRGRGEHDPAAPLPTVTASPEFGVAAAHLMTMRNAQKPFNGGNEPTHTVTAGGAHLNLVAAHLTKFRANSIGSGGDEPVATVTANSYIKRPGGAAPLGVVSAFLSHAQQGGNSRDASSPHSTVTASPKDQNQVMTAFLAQHNIDGHTGQGNPGRGADAPVSTITASGSQQGVVTGHMLDMHGSDMRMAGMDEPLRTLTAQGFHAAQVAAFLTKYYGTDQDPNLREPMHTATTKGRFGLVTVDIHGEPYIIADIGMRMLSPRELFRAQGFPESYIIERGHFAQDDGALEWRKLTKTAQTRMCGNSVCPQMAEALVYANVVTDTGAQSRGGAANESDAAWEFPLWQGDVA